MDQHFLGNPAKIRTLIGSASLRPDDRVVELGAGIGSVARHIPRTRSLTLVELDPRLARLLRARFPGARVIEADAVATLPTLEFDALFANLPYRLTVPVIDVLAGLRFRVAVMAVREGEELPVLPRMSIEHVVTLDEDDFVPRQPFRSAVVRVTPRPRVLSRMGSGGACDG